MSEIAIGSFINEPFPKAYSLYNYWYPTMSLSNSVPRETYTVFEEPTCLQGFEKR